MKALITAFALLSFVAATTLPVIQPAQAQTQTQAPTSSQPAVKAPAKKATKKKTAKKATKKKVAKAKAPAPMAPAATPSTTK